MSQPLLSILIPTVVGREKSFWRLCNELYRQAEEFGGAVEILKCIDNKEMPIGVKRQHLYEIANGVYSVQWDDDDFIDKRGIAEILDAIGQSPDCVTYREMCMMNGVYKSSNHSLLYDMWRDNHDGFDFTRSPFYKDAIRTEIAKSVPFEAIRYNEDERWSMALRPHLSSEVHLDTEIYHYIYNPKESHEERYGIK